VLARRVSGVAMCRRLPARCHVSRPPIPYSVKEALGPFSLKATGGSQGLLALVICFRLCITDGKLSCRTKAAGDECRVKLEALCSLWRLLPNFEHTSFDDSFSDADSWRQVKTEAHLTTSPHLTSPYLTLPYLTLPSPHLTLTHLTLTHLTLPHLTSPYLTLPHRHLTSPHLTLPHLTSPHLTLPYLTVTSPHPTLPYLTLP